MSDGFGFKDRLEPILRRLPAVERPKEHVHFKKKLGWTIGILILYFFLCNVPLFGLSRESIDIFAGYRAFFAGTSGTLMMLGIGPIVTASIILQLLVGAEIIKLDLSDPRDQSLFQGAQKLLVFVMIIAETIPQMIGGFVMPDEALAVALGVSTGTIMLLLFIQICIGGVLVLFMDEIVSKWGIGSGVGLFIVAGISWGLITGTFNWIPTSIGGIPGFIPRWVSINAEQGIASILTTVNGILSEIFPIIATIAIFAIVIYVESTRVEIPLAHSAVRGARGKFPVKLIYASVLPMILVRALQANVQMVGMMLWRKGVDILGTFAGSASGRLIPTSGLVYYLAPVNGPSHWFPAGVAMEFAELGLTPPATWQIALHLLTDASVLIIGGIIFAIFWVATANMGPNDVAHQIQRSGMQIPGFRRDVKSIERVMQRYIPKVTVIGGAFIGALTLLAGIMGTIGGVGGTGLLLTVSIIYRLYEDIASEQLMEMHPMIRKFIGAE